MTKWGETIDHVDHAQPISYIAVISSLGTGEYNLIMHERRSGKRVNVSFPVRLNWKDENGNQITEDGLTENVSPKGALVYLPRFLPQVGSTVKLTVTEQAEEVSVMAEVLRVERNAAHPQAALMLTRSIKLWKVKVFDYAAEVLANEEPEEIEPW